LISMRNLPVRKSTKKCTRKCHFLTPTSAGRGEKFTS